MGAPAILIGLAAGLSGVSAGVGGLSQYRAASYNADAARQNQRIALQQAKVEEDRFRQRSRFMQGRARAQAGAMGSDMTGSALDILNDNVLSNEMDAALIRYQGAMQSRQWGMQAQQARSQARSALISTPLNIAGALIGPLSQGYSSGAFGGGEGSSLLSGDWGGPRR